MAPHCIVVSLEIKPEHVKEFKKAAFIDAVGSRTEAQCYRFDVLQDKENPNKFIYYEAYENDGDAITVHRATPHFKAWSDFKAKYGVVSQSVVKADGINFTVQDRGEAKTEVVEKIVVQEVEKIVVQEVVKVVEKVVEKGFLPGLMIGGSVAAVAAYFLFKK
jgi:autoinducer 2-degrading protein